MLSKIYIVNYIITIYSLCHNLFNILYSFTEVFKYKYAYTFVLQMKDEQLTTRTNELKAKLEEEKRKLEKVLSQERGIKKLEELKQQIAETKKERFKRSTLAKTISGFAKGMKGITDHMNKTQIGGSTMSKHKKKQKETLWSQPMLGDIWNIDDKKKGSTKKVRRGDMI